MTFEEYCIKFSRRNIKKYSNGSNYSDVSRKKGRIAVPLITWCWIIWNQKIKVHSLGNSFSRVTLGGFIEISIFHFFGTLWRENWPILRKFATFQFFTFLEHFEGKISRFCENLRLIFPSKCSKKVKNWNFEKPSQRYPGKTVT